MYVSAKAVFLHPLSEQGIQAMIDLLIPNQTSGVKERFIDHYGKPELLFFGPDGTCNHHPRACNDITICLVEGTADMMDWAARMTSVHLPASGAHDALLVHARSRGAEWWKSFTTGKSAEILGGVPHDTYGMTSLSMRQFVLGIYKQLGLRERDITKVQTGGPGASVLCSRTFRTN